MGDLQPRQAHARHRAGARAGWAVPSHWISAGKASSKGSRPSAGTAICQRKSPRASATGTPDAFGSRCHLGVQIVAGRDPVRQRAARRRNGQGRTSAASRVSARRDRRRSPPDRDRPAPEAGCACPCADAARRRRERHAKRRLDRRRHPRPASPPKRRDGPAASCRDCLRHDGSRLQRQWPAR